MSHITKVAAVVLTEDDTRLLVVRKRGTDIFISPGGKIEPGETDRQALTRELNEELNCNLVESNFLFEADEIAAFENVPLILRVYRAHITGSPTPSAEIEEVRYLDKHEYASETRLSSGLTDHIIPAIWPSDVAVLFSGGRDSTATVQTLCSSGYRVKLMTFEAGLEITDLGNELKQLRKDELRGNLPAEKLEFIHIDVRGLVRTACFVHLVEDITSDKCQLVLLGQFICMLGSALHFCKAHNVPYVAYGATRYQSYFPEQRPEVIEVFNEWCATNDIKLLTPGSAWESEMDVKNILWRAGLDAKSYESTSMLADIDDNQPLPACLSYSKRKIREVSKLLGLRCQR